MCEECTLGNFNRPSKQQKQAPETESHDAGKNMYITCPFCGLRTTQLEFPLNRSFMYECPKCRETWHWCSGKNGAVVRGIGAFGCSDCGVFTHYKGIKIP